MHGMTIDRRVKKTKKQLRLALMHLMTQKSVSPEPEAGGGGGAGGAGGYQPQHLLYPL